MSILPNQLGSPAVNRNDLRQTRLAKAQETRWSQCWPIAIVTIVYLIAGKLGLRLAFVNPSATAVWPPTGIALAALLILGRRVWPGVFLGAFLVSLTTAGTWWTSLAIAAGNTMEGITGAVWVSRFAAGRKAFERPEYVFRFTVFAGLLSTALGATIGTITLYSGGLAESRDFSSIWLTWWLGDAGGALIMAPLVILWSERPRFPEGWTRVLEVLALLACVQVAGELVFGGAWVL